MKNRVNVIAVKIVVGIVIFLFILFVYMIGMMNIEFINSIDDETTPKINISELQKENEMLKLKLSTFEDPMWFGIKCLNERDESGRQKFMSTRFFKAPVECEDNYQEGYNNGYKVCNQGYLQNNN